MIWSKKLTKKDFIPPLFLGSRWLFFFVVETKSSGKETLACDLNYQFGPWTSIFIFPQEAHQQTTIYYHLRLRLSIKLEKLCHTFLWLLKGIDPKKSNFFSPPMTCYSHFNTIVTTIFDRAMSLIQTSSSRWERDSQAWWIGINASFCLSLSTWTFLHGAMNNVLAVRPIHSCVQQIKRARVFFFRVGAHYPFVLYTNIFPGAAFIFLWEKT